MSEIERVIEMNLAGKVVIITGAGAGIGAAAARMFAQEGAFVALADNNVDNARAEADKIGVNAACFKVDVRDSVDVKKMVDHVVDRFGNIDILINNAGRGLIGTVETTSETDWDDIISVNLTSVFLCSKHVAPIMRNNGRGVIVNTASNVATMGIMDRAAYVAAKGGVAALTRAMALDFAKDNIRVNSVAPGVTWSAYYENMLKTVPDPEAFKQRLARRSPLNRMAKPEEIASAILWLASDSASFATGAMFTVDGGMSTWCGPT